MTAAKRPSTPKLNSRRLTDAENEEARLALIIELVGSRKPSVVRRVLREQADSLPDMSRHYCKAIIAALGNKEEETINELIHFVNYYLVTDDGSPPNADLTWDLDCRLQIFEGSPLDAELYRRLAEHINNRWPNSAASLYYQGYSELVQDNAVAANDSWTLALNADSAFWLAAWELGALRTTEQQWTTGAAYFHRALAQEGSHRVFKLTFDAATCCLLANDMTGFAAAVRAAGDAVQRSYGEDPPDSDVLADHFEGVWLPENSDVRAKLSRALMDEFSARWPGSEVATHVQSLLSEVADDEGQRPNAEPTTSTVRRGERERRYWLWVTGPDYYLDENGRECLEDIGKWSCARDTRPGDLILLYRTTLNDPELKAKRRQRGDTPVGRDIAYLIRAEGEAYPSADWGWGCEASTLFVLRNPITLEDIKRNAVLCKWGALRCKFFGSVFAIEPEIWRALLDIAARKNPGITEVLTTQGEQTSVDSHVIESAAVLTNHAQSKPADGLSSFDCALLRLQILTAPPTLQRERSPAWPSDYIRAAMRDLTLTDSESRSLTHASAGYVRGGHSLESPVLALRGHCTPLGWQILFNDLRAVNRDTAGIDEIIAKIYRIVGIAPPIPAPMSTSSLSKDIKDLSKAPDKQLLPTPGANIRDLGCLGDIFGD